MDHVGKSNGVKSPNQLDAICFCHIAVEGTLKEKKRNLFFINWILLKDVENLEMQNINKKTLGKKKKKEAMLKLLGLSRVHTNDSLTQRGNRVSCLFL